MATPSVSNTSTSKRLPRASVAARWMMFSELARQTWVLIPYFFSKAAVSTAMSSTVADE